MAAADGGLTEQELSEIGATSLEGVRRQARQHNGIKEGLRKQLLELASSSCAVFIDSADCAREVHAEVARVSRHLAQLEAQLPLTAEHADSLLRDARAGIDARERNAHLLSRHAEVLEVLEQPQLMDTCVRNNFVDEALELEAAARARALVYADVPAISQVAAQVRRRRHRHHH